MSDIDDFAPDEEQFGDVIEHVEVLDEDDYIDRDVADDDEVEMLERALELARAKRDGEPKPNRAQRRAAKRNGITPPVNAPRPKDRQPKKTAQQAEAEDTEIVITAFDNTFRVRRSALQDDWKFFAAAAVGNLPSMLASMLGTAQFAKFCQGAMESGMRPNDAAKEMMELISQEMGVGSAGNS